MSGRDLVVVDVELAEAVRRRHIHTDKLSRHGNMKTIDGLLDERLMLAPRKKPEHKAITSKE